MLPACAWLARRAAAGRASAPPPAAIAAALGTWARGQVVSRPRDDDPSSSPPSTPVATPWPLSRPAAARAQPQPQQVRRAFSSSSGGGDADAERAAAAAAAAAASLQAELSALNRELADVFGEPPPDDPAGGGGILGGMSSSSSSSFASRPPPPPPPPPPLPRAPPPTPPPSFASSADARLSHVDSRTGRASMVDVSPKIPTLREARASCLVRLSRRAAAAVAANSLKKGDVLGTSRLAGIMGAKRTGDLIPLCHPLLLSRVDVTAELVDVAAVGEGGGGAGGGARPEEEEEAGREEGAAAGGGGEGAGGRGRAVRVACVARVGAGSTGVEMEALTGASVAALTVYDMVKAVGKGCAVVTDLRLDYKVGGKGGAWARRGLEREDGGGWALLMGAAAEAAGAEAGAAGRGGGGGAGRQ